MSLSVSPPDLTTVKRSDPVSPTPRAKKDFREIFKDARIQEHPSWMQLGHIIASASTEDPQIGIGDFEEKFLLTFGSFVVEIDKSKNYVHADFDLDRGFACKFQIFPVKPIDRGQLYTEAKLLGMPVALQRISDEMIVDIALMESGDMVDSRIYYYEVYLNNDGAGKYRFLVAQNIEAALRNSINN